MVRASPASPIVMDSANSKVCIKTTLLCRIGMFHRIDLAKGMPN